MPRPLPEHVCEGQGGCEGGMNVKIMDGNEGLGRMGDGSSGLNMIEGEGSR